MPTRRVMGSPPGASNLNHPAGTTIANRVVVPVVDGRVSLTNYTGDVQVIADLDGYYSTGSPAST